MVRSSSHPSSCSYGVAFVLRASKSRPPRSTVEGARAAQTQPSLQSAATVSHTCSRFAPLQFTTLSTTDSSFIYICLCTWVFRGMSLWSATRSNARRSAVAGQRLRHLSAAPAPGALELPPATFSACRVSCPGPGPAMRCFEPFEKGAETRLPFLLPGELLVKASARRHQRHQPSTPDFPETDAFYFSFRTTSRGSISSIPTTALACTLLQGGKRDNLQGRGSFRGLKEPSVFDDSLSSSPPSCVCYSVLAALFSLMTPLTHLSCSLSRSFAHAGRGPLLQRARFQRGGPRCLLRRQRRIICFGNGRVSVFSSGRS